MANGACTGSDFPFAHLKDALVHGKLTARGIACVRQDLCREIPQRDAAGIRRYLTFLRVDSCDDELCEELQKELQKFLGLRWTTRENVFREMCSDYEEHQPQRRQEKLPIDGRRPHISHRVAASA